MKNNKWINSKQVFLKKSQVSKEDFGTQAREIIIKYHIFVLDRKRWILDSIIFGICR